MAVDNVITLDDPVTKIKTKKGHQEWNFEATNGTGVPVVPQFQTLPSLLRCQRRSFR